MQILVTLMVLAVAVETMRHMLWAQRERIVEALMGIAPEPEIIVCDEGGSVVPFRQRVYSVTLPGTLRQAA
jgi:hypothetical protein